MKIETVTQDGWYQDVQALWDDGQRQAAINLLLSRINAAVPKRHRLPCLQLSYCMFLMGDVRSAERVLSDALQSYPEDVEILENLAVVIGRQQGRAAEAASIFRKVIARRPQSVNAWDGLAASLAGLKDWRGARLAGAEALRRKDTACGSQTNWQLPTIAPKRFLEERSQTHVIAFSLWGENPRYLRGILRNLLLLPEIYPGWTARIYLDSTVPTEFEDIARSLGAQIQREPDGQSLRQKLCWRFQVANDPAVGRFLVRDCDSVISIREQLAVAAWIASDKYFSVMRDWWTHTDLILAGLWGGVASILPDLSDLAAAFQPRFKEVTQVDQWFLRDCVWPQIRQSVLVFDRCYDSVYRRPWPDPDPPGDYHVGQNEFAARHAFQRQWLAGWIERYSWLQLPSNVTAACEARTPLTISPKRS
jgi:tetratricopeptide (TPR) repeat protein